MEGGQESEDYLKSQIITYIGNKRSLLGLIEAGIVHAGKLLGKDRISISDVFSGSGIVSRMARRYAHTIHCNDIELYSFILNSCYQSNAGDIALDDIRNEITRLDEAIRSSFEPGFIAELYAPEEDDDISPGERVFYTRRNAVFLDSFCRNLKQVPPEIRPLILAPVLAQASMHANTSGVFKGFYKNRQGVGQFGEAGRNALTRIRKEIGLKEPVFSNFPCRSFIYRKDANLLAGEMEEVDVAYLDSPYNQHPYGSNYFMLNLLCDYRRPADISRVSGIPPDWNRSSYNKPAKAEDALFDLVEKIKAKIVLISYNSEGFISHESFLSGLRRLGRVKVMDTRYNTFRGCRNLASRDIHVTEFLYLLDKR